MCIHSARTLSHRGDDGRKTDQGTLTPATASCFEPVWAVSTFKNWLPWYPVAVPVTPVEVQPAQSPSLACPGPANGLSPSLNRHRALGMRPADSGCPSAAGVVGSHVVVCTNHAAGNGSALVLRPGFPRHCPGSQRQLSDQSDHLGGRETEHLRLVFESCEATRPCLTGPCPPGSRVIWDHLRSADPACVSCQPVERSGISAAPSRSASAGAFAGPYVQRSAARSGPG